MTKKDEPIQIWDGVWYATPFGKPVENPPTGRRKAKSA